jgi:acyl-CoA reductase-like NAD-dependent aldehyde dehydrogenase
MTSYTVINPATEQPVTQVELSTLEQTDAAIQRAASSQETWRAVAPGDRARLLRRFAEQVDSHIGELAALET